MPSTVILGAGVIGVSTAYYLSDHETPSTIHLVEPSAELFDSASGFAGGFLAKDWFSSGVASLGRLSYGQHRKLVGEHGGRERWGYSATSSISYAPGSAGTEPGRRGADWLLEGTNRAGAAPSVVDDPQDRRPAWLRRRVGDRADLIGEDGSTAQVNPRELCGFLLGACLDRGVQLHHPARAISVSTDVRGEVASVRMADTQSSTETDIPCTRVIVTAGAWSGQVFGELFDRSKLELPISSLAGHSLLLNHSLEIYSWIGGQLYVAGVNSSTIPLPKAVSERKVDGDAMSKLKEMARELLGSSAGEDDLEVVREGLCFRPVTPWGTPIVCRISDEHLGIGVTTRPGADGGVFLAAGHGPWGISLSLGTGMVLAEMVQGRSPSADVGSLGLR